MMSWADLDKDGMISFDEYQKIIRAGCDGQGTRTKAPEPVDVPPLGTPVTTWEDGRTIYL